MPSRALRSLCACVRAPKHEKRRVDDYEQVAAGVVEDDDDADDAVYTRPAIRRPSAATAESKVSRAGRRRLRAVGLKCGECGE